MGEEAGVTKAAIEKAISRPGDHSCQNNPAGRCRVTSGVSADLIFVENKNYPQCPYYIPFGYSGFCQYPPRKELYLKYRV
jgi:hypothetical protein